MIKVKDRSDDTLFLLLPECIDKVLRKKKEKSKKGVKWEEGLGSRRDRFSQTE